MKTFRASLLVLGWGMTVAAAFAPKAEADSGGWASGSSSAQPSPSTSTSTSTPSVSIGMVQVIRGGSAPKSLGAALRGVQPVIDACYADAIEKDGDGDANVSLRLEIDSTGRVVSSTVASSEDASVALRGCARDAFDGLAAGQVGKPIEILVPIAFTREASTDSLRPISACPASWEDDGVEGELPDALSGAIASRAARAGYCFKRPPAAGEPVTLKKGTMEIHLRLAPDGSVCGASAVGDSFDRPSLTSCVLETMSEPYENRPVGAIEVVVPLSFQGN